MGVFENPILASGTVAVAKAMAEAEGATTIIGGGDSAAAVAQLGLRTKCRIYPREAERRSNCLKAKFCRASLALTKKTENKFTEV